MPAWRVWIFFFWKEEDRISPAWISYRKDIKICEGNSKPFTYLPGMHGLKELLGFDGKAAKSTARKQNCRRWRIWFEPFSFRLKEAVRWFVSGCLKASGLQVASFRKEMAAPAAWQDQSGKIWEIFGGSYSSIAVNCKTWCEKNQRIFAFSDFCSKTEILTKPQRTDCASEKTIQKTERKTK